VWHNSRFGLRKFFFWVFWLGNTLHFIQVTDLLNIQFVTTNCSSRFQIFYCFALFLTINLKCQNYFLGVGIWAQKGKLCFQYMMKCHQCQKVHLKNKQALISC